MAIKVARDIAQKVGSLGMLEPGNAARVFPRFTLLSQEHEKRGCKMKSSLRMIYQLLTKLEPWIKLNRRDGKLRGVEKPISVHLLNWFRLG